MKREPHKAQKTDPISIPPASRPGPNFDPMDWIVQHLQNVQSFLAHLDQYPNDLHYLDTHLSQILALRRNVSELIQQLAEEPYDYTKSRLDLLKKENEQIFSYVEGATGAMKAGRFDELKRFVSACEKRISQFDGDLTP